MNKIEITTDLSYVQHILNTQQIRGLVEQENKYLHQQSKKVGI